MDQENKTPAQDKEAAKGKSKHFLVVYIIGLFSVALVLILLSYLTQVRANKQLASLQTQVTEQTNVAQGAQQQMITLQNTVQEQQKRMDEMSAAIGVIREKLDIPEGEKVEDGVSLLQERYIALDALQQVRRLASSEDNVSARELLVKMIKSYGLNRLLPTAGEDAALLGQNAVEFYNFCAQYGIDTSSNAAAIGGNPAP